MQPHLQHSDDGNVGRILRELRWQNAQLRLHIDDPVQCAVIARRILFLLGQLIRMAYVWENVA